MTGFWRALVGTAAALAVAASAAGAAGTGSAAAGGTGGAGDSGAVAPAPPTAPADPKGRAPDGDGAAAAAAVLEQARRLFALPAGIRVSVEGSLPEQRAEIVAQPPNRFRVEYRSPEELEGIVTVFDQGLGESSRPGQQRPRIEYGYGRHPAVSILATFYTLFAVPEQGRVTGVTRQGDRLAVAVEAGAGQGGSRLRYLLDAQWAVPLRVERLGGDDEPGSRVLLEWSGTGPGAQAGTSWRPGLRDRIGGPGDLASARANPAGAGADPSGTWIDYRIPALAEGATLRLALVRPLGWFPQEVSIPGQGGIARFRFGQPEVGVDLDPGLFATPQVRELERQLKRAQRALEAARYREALAALREAVRIDPYRAGFHNQMGYAAMKLGDWAVAEAEFEQVIHLQPEDPTGYNNLAYAYLEAGFNHSEAVRLAERATAADPHSPVFLDTLGWAYYHAGRHGEAVEVLTRAVGRLSEIADPSEQALVYYHLALALEASGRLDEALAAVRTALETDPTLAAASQALARLESASQE